jgi:hypothetical protein
MRTIACLLDFDCPGDAHLGLAASLAWRTNARLRLVTVIPTTDEATLARSIDSRAPLMPEVAMQTIRAAFSGEACPEVDVAIGDTAKELPGMLARCEADLAFIGPGRALGGILSQRLEPCIDQLPCPAICVDGASSRFEQWAFDQRAARHAQEQSLAS